MDVINGQANGTQAVIQKIILKSNLHPYYIKKEEVL